ncbi:hypothetical protein ZWY2020_002673 [Hordeum vulgare]|nr:hypothetical protein ZWY2020_002673 [Hordeum vulgare]
MNTAGAAAPPQDTSSSAKNSPVAGASTRQAPPQQFGIDKSKMHQGRNIPNSKSSTLASHQHPIKEEALPGTKVHDDPTTPNQAKSPAGAARGQVWALAEAYSSADDIENESNKLNRIKNYLYGKLVEHTGQSVEKVKIFIECSRHSHITCDSD